MKLTASDLRAFPVWEYAIDEEGDGEQDETWVRPVACGFVRKDEYSQIVATDFTTSAGRKLQGFMVVTTAKGQVEITPGVVVGSVGYMVLPTVSRKLAVARKYDWSLKARDRFCQALAQPEAEVFPLRFSLRVLVRGGALAREGVIR